MRVIQLSLFDFGAGDSIAPAAQVAQVVAMNPVHSTPEHREATCEEYDEMAVRQGIDYRIYSEPCKGCPLLDFCTDECGRLGFTKSVNDPKRYGYAYRL